MRDQEFSFQKSVVVITGASSGIGKAAAKAFFDAGAKICINSRSRSRIEAAAQEIDPTGKRVIYEVGDISKLSTINMIAERTVEELGDIDILVNNAGAFNQLSFMEHTEADFDRYLNVILKATFFMSQAVIPSMKRRGRGSIINLGSLWGLQAIGQAPCAAHSAAKAAVHALTRTLAIEVARHSIRVNAIAPAFVDKIPVDPPELCSFHPLMRRGRPLDVVEAIMFLASETASWITGVVLPVDGGVSAGRHD